MDSKKKLDQRKREIVKQLRKIDEVQELPQDTVDEQKVVWRQQLKHIEQRRNDLLPEHEKLQKLSLKLQSFAGQIAVAQEG